MLHPRWQRQYGNVSMANVKISRDYAPNAMVPRPLLGLQVVASCSHLLQLVAARQVIEPRLVVARLEKLLVPAPPLAPQKHT